MSSTPAGGPNADQDPSWELVRGKGTRKGPAQPPNLTHVTGGNTGKGAHAAPLRQKQMPHAQPGGHGPTTTHCTGAAPGVRGNGSGGVAPPGMFPNADVRSEQEARPTAAHCTDSSTGAAGTHDFVMWEKDGQRLRLYGELSLEIPAQADVDQRTVLLEPNGSHRSILYEDVLEAALKKVEKAQIISISRQASRGSVIKLELASPGLVDEICRDGLIVEAEGVNVPMKAMRVGEVEMTLLLNFVPRGATVEEMLLMAQSFEVRRVTGLKRYSGIQEFIWHKTNNNNGEQFI